MNKISDRIYDAPRIAAQSFIQDPAIVDFHYETSCLMSDIFMAHHIQSEDPRLFTDSLSPFLRSRVGPRKAQWPEIQGPLELFDEYRAKRIAAIDKAGKYLASALENRTRNTEWRLTHYRNCREVAGWHQVIELIEQGMVAFWAAREDKILIFQGNSYVLFNVRTFIC